MRDVPLGGKRKIVVAHLLEVALFPFAAVGERDVVAGERDERIFLRQIGQDSVWMFLGVANNVSHAGVFPAIVDLGVAALAGDGAGVTGGGDLRHQCDGQDKHEKDPVH